MKTQVFKRGLDHSRKIRRKVLEASTDCGFGRSRAGCGEAMTAFHAKLSGTRLPACLLLLAPTLFRRLFIHTTHAFHVLHPARHYASPSSLPSPSLSNRINLASPFRFSLFLHLMLPPSSRVSSHLCIVLFTFSLRKSRKFKHLTLGRFNR